MLQAYTVEKKGLFCSVKVHTLKKICRLATRGETLFDTQQRFARHSMASTLQICFLRLWYIRAHPIYERAQCSTANRQAFQSESTRVNDQGSLGLGSRNTTTWNYLLYYMQSFPAWVRVQKSLHFRIQSTHWHSSFQKMTGVGGVTHLISKETVRKRYTSSHSFHR